MEPRNRSIRFRVHDLDNVTWTPIYPSAPCVEMSLKNAGQDTIFLRTDDTSSASEVEFAPGDRVSFQGRHGPDIPIVFAKTDGSTGPLEVTETNLSGDYRL